MRVISMESTNKIYHRPTCSHALRIKSRNRMTMSLEEAERNGCRPCKCCNSVGFIYRSELANMERFIAQYGFLVDLKDNAIYVRTDIASWKIVYRTYRQKFILFHCVNDGARPSLGELELIHYHRQGDIWEARSIAKCLSYIGAHDEFKMKMPDDYRKMPRDTKRQKRYYESAKRREAKKNERRLDNLFCMIEEKEGIKKYSIC